MKKTYFAAIVMLAGVLATTAHAGISEAVWALELRGSLGIQNFSSSLQPQLQSESFNTKDLLRILGAQNTLALTVDMSGGETNLLISTFNRTSRENTRLTSKFTTTTTILADGKNLTFSVNTRLQGSGLNAGGAQLRLAGRGRLIQGVPGGFRGNVGGWIIDLRPGDLGGTTGVVLRATMHTGALLRP